MKPKLFASIIFFYAALLLTIFVMPMLVAAHGGVGKAESWDRFLDIPGSGGKRAGTQTDVRVPSTDVPDYGSAKRMPVDRTLPDAGMINKPADKARAKALKA